MNNLKYISSVIFVKDIQKSKEFYTTIFNQEIQYDFGKNVSFKSGLAIWQPGEGHEINEYLLKKNEKGNRFELYFETNNLDALVTLMNEKKIRRFHEVKEEPWGQRTIRVFDPDDHLVEIGESMETFVRRLKISMSDEEVSGKTGLSSAQINDLLNH